MYSNKITRRQVLKTLLAASGGLTAAAFLPSKWLKPMVMSGVLPVHARASSVYTSANPALAGNAVGSTNGHVLNNFYPYIYFTFGSPSIEYSNITAQLIGPDVSGVVVRMDIKNIFKSVGYAYYDDPVAKNILTAFPVIKTADGSGTAHFQFLLPSQLEVSGSTFDLNFTYWRGTTLLYESNVAFSVA
jgi:hypothetical protein